MSNGHPLRHRRPVASDLLNTPRRMLLSARRPVILLTAVLSLATADARAQLLPVWQIGVDEDPLASGYNATDEFSTENYINDPKKYTIGQAIDVINEQLVAKGYTLFRKGNYLKLWPLEKTIPPDLIPRVSVQELD